MEKAGSNRINLARGLVALVLFFNLQAAVLFIVSPAAYTAGFEISGLVGQKLVQGMGILFLMWNVPYIWALLHPVRNRISLISAVIMQSIGFFGETLLWISLPTGHEALNATVIRFMAFDGGGLLALIFAWLVTRKQH